jgi:DNA topoisomerase I
MPKNTANRKALVIVESPAKARSISRFLGPDFIVESSIGHIRDLPSAAAEIPPAVKGEPWARLGVNVDDNFTPLYIIPREKRAQVKKLKDLLQKAGELYLATDEDREGEAIAWHLVQVLKPKVPIKRMVFGEITKAAITKATENTRDIDERLVQAQEARRILDRLFGYEVSPVLWRKVGPRLSAGRVQSVATRLVVERERDRMAFVSASYCGLTAELWPVETPEDKFEARLVELDGRRVAVGKDYDERTGALKEPEKVTPLNEEAAQTLAAILREAPFTVAQVSEKRFVNRPSAPFITSTLQQEAARQLRFTAERTMRVAQSLYENGFITYMRTDSTMLSSQAIEAARRQIVELYGRENLPEAPRFYTSKAKNAQEAHEAIRPAGDAFRTPQRLASELDADQLRLYELIWKRTVACQMKDATGFRTQVRIEAPAGSFGQAILNASGKVIEFAGYLRAYVEGSDDPRADLEDQEKLLPPLREGQALRPERVEATQHTTQPPARYTEASLIKELEERGIGRPSTYAAILRTIQDRGYVWRKGTALVPTFTAFAVINLLVHCLPDLVDYDFTADMEAELDRIAAGEHESVPWLQGFYFGDPGGARTDRVATMGLKQLVSTCSAEADMRCVSAIPIGQTRDGQPVQVRVGRYGPYVQVGESDRRASVPDQTLPDELTVERILELVAQAAQGAQVLGHDPETGKPVYVKSGRFGPYVQLGEPELTPNGKLKRGGKPKMASLWPSMSIETITFEEALMLLSFPREVGTHPETGEVITAQDGRFGPYIKMGTESRSLPGHESLCSISLNEAVELLKQPKGRRGRAAQAAVLAELGTHPQHAVPVQVKSGRYGPYVTDGTVNASVPKGRDPQQLTLEDGLELLAAREEKLRAQGQDPRAPGARRRGSRKAPVAAKTRKTAAGRPASKPTGKPTGKPANKPTGEPVGGQVVKKTAPRKIASKKTAAEKPITRRAAVG